MEHDPLHFYSLGRKGAAVALNSSSVSSVSIQAFPTLQGSDGDQDTVPTCQGHAVQRVREASPEWGRHVLGQPG